MKFALVFLATAAAFVSQAVASPAPQGGLPIFICNPAQGITCPNGLKCCPPAPLTGADEDGTCVSPGRACAL